MDWHISPALLECSNGYRGTHGGSGGVGGGGGKGGGGGGSSIGVLAIRSRVLLEKCSVSTTNGGKGGNGGVGGLGAPGRKALVDYYAAKGGDGGNGGKGGDGGGGMGGCSIALAMYQSTGVYGSSYLVVGPPGTGGGPVNTKSEALAPLC